MCDPLDPLDFGAGHLLSILTSAPVDRFGRRLGPIDRLGERANALRDQAAEDLRRDPNFQRFMRAP